MANSADPVQKPTDLDLHCLQRQGISGLSRTRVKCIESLDYCVMRYYPITKSRSEPSLLNQMEGFYQIFGH